MMDDRFRFRYWYKPLKIMSELKDKDFLLEFLNNNYEVMQCTGLKDIQGKPIYESDLLRSNDYPFNNDGQDNYYAQVCWDDESAGFFYWTFKNPKYDTVVGRSTGNTGNINDYEFEIIGNIYENEYLLGEWVNV